MWNALLGGLVGLMLGALFEDYFKALVQRVLRRIRIVRYRLRQESTIQSPERFSLGTLFTAWVTIDGDGQLKYLPETIICRVEEDAAPLPPEIQELRDSIEKREAAKRQRGLASQWNGPQYSLDRYAISRTIPDEHLQITLTLRPSDYYTFQATVVSLDVKLGEAPSSPTIRERYLRGRESYEPVPFLAQGFGLVLVIVTHDGKLLLSRRQDTLGVRPGELDASVVEGLQPALDRSLTHRGPDVYHTALRGAKEELGIDLVQEEVTFLGFGVDMEFYQWALLGMAYVDETADEVLQRRCRGLGGKWEMKTYYAIEFSTLAVFQYLKHEMDSRRVWSTALVAIYWALVREYGLKPVEEACRRTFG